MSKGVSMREAELYDYVFATKYSDGSPGDPYCVGYLVDIDDSSTPTRYHVADAQGVRFRANGFRRVKAVSYDIGAQMLQLKAGMSHTVSLWKVLADLQNQKLNPPEVEGEKGNYPDNSEHNAHVV